jgi:hypothetical protein
LMSLGLAGLQLLSLKRSSWPAKVDVELRDSSRDLICSHGNNIIVIAGQSVTSHK